MDKMRSECSKILQSGHRLILLNQVYNNSLGVLMVLVLGFELPVAEFLLFLNIAMLFYIIFSMIELRDLRKLRRDLTLQLEEVRFLLKSIRFSPVIKGSIDKETSSKRASYSQQMTPTTKGPSTSKNPPTPKLPKVEG